jgi:hypothetical protein
MDLFLIVTVSVVAFEKVLGTTVRALRLPRFLHRQKNLGMRVPEVHAGHRTGQWQI